MGPSQFSLHEIGSVLRRRAKVLIIPPLLISLLAVGAAYKLPRMYESSTTILVQRNGVKNPIASMNNSMSVDDDPLRYIDEIIFSRTTMQLLMDSLKVSSASFTELELWEYIETLKNNIRIVHNGPESFVISFSNRDPGRAQAGASALTNIFILSTSSSNNQRNDVTVHFYEQKLEEFRQKLEQSQEQMMPKLRERAQENPAANTFLNDAQRQIREIDQRMKEYTRYAASIQALPSILATQAGHESLFELSRLDIPYAADLRSQLTKYEDVMSRYTPQHPEAAKITRTVNDVLDRMLVGLRTEMENNKIQLDDLRRRQTQIIGDMLPTSQRVGQDKESNVLIYQRLYDGMKLRLEEAQVQQAIGKNENSQFTIIDPALRPIRPTKPNRLAIIGGGIAIGLLLGFVLAVVSELFDTTVRTTKAIEMYQKPIIALLPVWTSSSQK